MTWMIYFESKLEATFIDVKNKYLHWDINKINKSCFQLEDVLMSGARRSPDLG